jgi:hypothetical protein
MTKIAKMPFKYSFNGSRCNRKIIMPFIRKNVIKLSMKIHLAFPKTLQATLCNLQEVIKMLILFLKIKDRLYYCAHLNFFPKIINLKK